MANSVVFRDLLSFQDIQHHSGSTFPALSQLWTMQTGGSTPEGSRVGEASSPRARTAHLPCRPTRSSGWSVRCGGLSCRPWCRAEISTCGDGSFRRPREEEGASGGCGCSAQGRLCSTRRRWRRSCRRGRARLQARPSVRIFKVRI